MKSFEEIRITVPNWENYNGKDRAKIRSKHPDTVFTWFRISNNIFYDNNMLRLTTNDRYIFMCVLGICSDQDSTSIVTSMYQLRAMSGLSTSRLSTHLVQIANTGLIQLHDIIDGGQTQTNKQTNKQTVAAKSQATIAPKDNSLNKLTWESYKNSYKERYGTDPVRNAKTNSLISQFVKKIGAESPDVISFYISHSSAYYVQRGHPLGAASADAEKLRTEWFTGRQITGADARKVEKNNYEMNAVKKVFYKAMGEENEQRGNIKTINGNSNHVQSLPAANRGGSDNSVSGISQRIGAKLGITSDKGSD